MTFPLEPHFVADFARGLETILVIEEKRSFLELQLREALYNAPERPLILGKQDETGPGASPRDGRAGPGEDRWRAGPLSAGARIHRRRLNQNRRNRGPASREDRHAHARPSAPAARTTGLRWCSKARWPPAASVVTACRRTQGQSGRGYAFLTHMGGEGAPWIGMAPFVERKHIFQNVGDGTYFHSGSLAVEACRGGRRQHHLQDSLQRRGGHDRAARNRAARCRFRHSRANSRPTACARRSCSPTMSRNTTVFRWQPTPELRDRDELA